MRPVIRLVATQMYRGSFGSVLNNIKCTFLFFFFCFGFRPVLKDLSRILILLNRPEDRIGLPPADWETLLAWGERVLRRYKKQNPDQVSAIITRVPD